MAELYRQYQGEVYRYLCWFTQNPALAEDLTQECFLHACRGILRFENRSSLRTWLLAIARRCALDWLRKNRQHLPLDALPELAALEDVQDAILTWEQGALARQALERLEPRSRQAVALRCQGLSFEAVGRALGVSEGSARVLYHRAVQKLRALLREEGEG